MQYGCRAYYDSEFGKDKRKTIVNQPLDKPLLTYCALDVITLQHIRKLQIRRAKDIGYDKFNIMVVGQMSDLLHTFSCLEVSGSKVDINWLFFLKSKGSPMMKHKAAVTRKLNETKGVERTNNLLRKKSGAPSTGLFGKAKMSLFKANKRDHLQTLMFKVLKLKPESQGKDGLGKVDKAFQKKYADVPEVALYQELQKVKKLYNSYVKAFVNQWGDDADMRKDGCIRPFYQFRDVVTGRTSAKKPSLHQIPSRNDVSDYIKGVFKNRQDLGKAIKRMFIVDPGRILIKVDYAAHEVRGWSIISGDQKVADVFQHGLDLRTRYKIAPTPALAEKIEYEGDVHKINAAYFFSMDIKDVDKPKRNSVKTVIFGLIYQQGFEGLAASTGQTVQAIKDLTAAFLKRFPIGVGWFDRAKESARKNLFIESPLGRRRNLWGYLIPKSAQKHDGVYAAADRRAVNSPIQGMGSDYLVSGGRCIERLKYEHYRKTKHYPDFFMTNSVHDSLEFSVAYEDFWLAIRLIEEGLTTDVMKVMEKRHNMKFPVALEIDFEVGSNLRDCPGWDYSLKGMEKLIFDALTQQKEELGYAVDPKKVTKRIMTEQYEHMPDWAKKQAWNIGMKMKDMGDDPRSKADRYTKKERRQLEESKEAA
jgi:DNA polymerase I-like protein with 3'-5' exonuclease and polymerase domains